MFELHELNQIKEALEHVGFCTVTEIVENEKLLIKVKKTIEQLKEEQA